MTRVPQHYVPKHLSRKEKRQQKKELAKSRRAYKGESIILARKSKVLNQKEVVMKVECVKCISSRIMKRLQ